MISSIPMYDFLNTGIVGRLAFLVLTTSLQVFHFINNNIPLDLFKNTIFYARRHQNGPGDVKLLGPRSPESCILTGIV